MAAAFVALSGLVLAIPVIFVVIGLMDPALRVTFAGTAALVLIGSFGVWVFYKPRSFELTESELLLTFPMREIPIARDDITGARVLRRADIRTTLGFAMRVGVGGLFGVFGLLWTSKLGWVRIYVTTTDGWLLVSRRNALPLLISPKDPEAMRRALG